MKLNKKQRAELKQKYDGHCAYCGVDLGDKWHADHIESVGRDFNWVKDLKKGCHVAKPNGVLLRPENDTIENLNPACIPCNINKSSMSIEGWRRVLGGYVNGLNKHACHSSYRHAKRFGLIVETQKAVVFYFENFKKSQKNEIQPEYKIGDIVLLKDRNYPYTMYITNILPDGRIELKTTSKGWPVPNTAWGLYYGLASGIEHANAEEIAKGERL